MPTRTITSNLDALGQIRREALEAGATSLKLMSQCVGLLQDHLKAKGHGSGICRALALEWIKGQSEGTSFIDKALGVGGVVNINALAPLIAQYDTNEGLVGEKEDAYIRAQLTAAGLKSGGSAMLVSNLIKGGVGTWFTSNNNPKAQGPLRLLSTRAGYSHAMALDLRSFSFFDPNWGQFNFKDEQSLNNFLNASMFPKGTNPSGYPEYCGVKMFQEASIDSYTAAS